MKQTSLKAALTRIVLTSSIAFGVLATAGLAQTALGTKTLTADVPFAFTSGSASMPAGRYRLLQTPQHMLFLRSDDFKSARYLSAFPVRHLDFADHSKLVFHRYGDKYFLFQVWVGGYSEGVQLRKSRPEQDLILSRDHPQPFSTEIATETQH